MKETESANENIAAGVDKFPKLRTTRISIDDCHWLAQEEELISFPMTPCLPGSGTSDGNENWFKSGRASRYSGWQGM